MSTRIATQDFALVAFGQASDMSTRIATEDYVDALAEASGAPDEPVAGMMAWYDAADLGTLNVSSDRVDSWEDKSGNGHDIAMTSTTRPLYGGGGARSINGIVVPEFQGGQHLDNAGAMTWPSDRTSTAMFLCLTDTLGGGRHTLASGTSDGCNGFSPSSVLETTRTNVAILAQGVGLVAGVPIIVAQRLTATTIEHFCNGMKQLFSESSSFTAGRLLRLGAHFGGELWDGLIAEAIFRDSAQSDADMEADALYLKNKWGLPW